MTFHRTPHSHPRPAWRSSKNAAVLAYERTSTHRVRQRRTLHGNLLALALTLGGILSAAGCIWTGGAP